MAEFGAEFEEFLNKKNTPEPVRELLKKCGITDTGMFACMTESAENLAKEVLPNIEGWGNMAFDERTRLKAGTTAAWLSAKVLFANSINPPKKESGTTPVEVEEGVAPDVRQKMLKLFTDRYGHSLPLEQQPSSVALKKILKGVEKKEAEFMNLGKIHSAVGPSDDEKRTTLPGGVQMTIHTDGQGKNVKFAGNPLAFLNQVRILCNGYVLASLLEEDKEKEKGVQSPLWFDLNSAILYTSTIERVLRTECVGAPPLFHKAMEVEKMCRMEWHSASQRQEHGTLSEVVRDTLDRLGPMWPTKWEAPRQAVGKGKGKTSEDKYKQRSRPYADKGAKKKEQCKFLLNNGSCKFGEKCYYSHE